MLGKLGQRTLVHNVLIHETQARARTIVDAHHEVERLWQQDARQFGKFLFRVDRAAQTVLERNGECGKPGMAKIIENTRAK